ncbi:Rubredoxin (modular protein) [uncultured Desulfobacterium sp.]|uniref:Rubredoxin n=1 Tax=uncultured Desulfobacterium sp. TaxID=201089 RepID=A0A445MYQ9_9BACT|nr:Rubredoxin (modular protein) [uncultured Desulfobacterium sp.]
MTGPARFAGHRRINLKKRPRKSTYWMEAIEMDRYVCTMCGYVYDPKEGDPDGGIEPGTPFEDLPDDWTCPICGASKAEFNKE